MLGGKGSRGRLRCSFCGRGDQEVRQLVAGPKVLICDDCACRCMTIHAEAGGLDPQAVAVLLARLEDLLPRSTGA